MIDVRNRTVFVLCHPADVRNVGGAIRAVVNSGIAEIRVVTEQTFDDRDLLCYSSSAIEHAHLTFYPDVASAIADCDRVVGTSRVYEMQMLHLSGRQLVWQGVPGDGTLQSCSDVKEQD